MKALIDTNILMDFIDKRQDFFKDAKKVFALCRTDKVDAFVSAHSLMDLCYLVRKTKTQDERLRMLRQLCGLFVVVETTSEAILAAAEHMDFSDFEDSVVNQAAVKAGADCIVTRNQGDFKATNIPVLSPIEFIETFDEDGCIPSSSTRIRTMR